MDNLDRKVDQVYTAVALSYPGERPARKRLSRLIVVAAAAIVAFHLVKLSLYTPAPPRRFVHLAPATTEFSWESLEPSTEIQWTSCFDGHLCARLLLPLDYLSDDPSGPTTAIALRMIPARDRANYRGTVLVNPGGPGGSGTYLVARVGQNLSTVVGDSFDILGFDPRGVGASTPRLDCFASKSQRDIWLMQEGPQLMNASDEGVLGLFRARTQVVGDRCAERAGGEEGIARFMSTASVATDMLKITEKLGQEKLQYWGFSYGSILGQYFTAMYPDKVGRVIIDGVYDAHNYRGALWSSNLIDNEAVIDSLFTFCHQAGPLKCALYEPTPSAIRERYYRVLDAVERNPIPIAGTEPPLVLTRKILNGQIFEAAYNPLASYGFVVDTIRAIETHNQTALTTLAQAVVRGAECQCTDGPPEVRDNDAFSAIACGDGEARTFDLEIYKAHYANLTHSAPIGGRFWALHALKCMEWSVRPKWRYMGPLAARNTSNPILILQPKWDPVCPLGDALAVRERYGGAGMLVQNSYGHCSLSAPSVCTARHVRAYMEEGKVPAEGTICEPDAIPFVGEVNDVWAMSAEDRELLDALKGLSKVVPMFGA